MNSHNKMLTSKYYTEIVCVIAVIILSSCTMYGPVFIKSERNQYNQAIQKTNDEQLLLNLVRLKYHENPLFMEVNNIASQFTLQNEIGLGATLQAGAKGIFTPSTSTYVEERPTISYSPLHGENFVKGVLTPITLKTIVLLFHSGWSIERVFKVCLQRMDKLKNAPSASGPTPKIAPKTNKFFKAAKLLHEIQTQGGLEVTYRIFDGEPQLVIYISNSFKNSPPANQFARLLNTNLGKMSYVFSSPSIKDNESIDIVTRSLLGVMFYLSQAVEVPEQDVTEGKVAVTKTVKGEVFNWAEITGELLHVYNSPSSPEDAGLKIFYRNYWFYINDSDLISKSTFSLLAQIYALQSGE
ncbi:MAG: hypothetical protein HN885_01595 [Nitrospina sp.]|nr:hypothetical protein [Nitrospina sp.]MBT7271671.1 hypothetical protein [Nitrospina sp.]